MIQQTAVMVNGVPLIVTFTGKRIIEAMRPDGTTFVPRNPRFIKRVRAQLPIVNPATEAGGCTPEELQEYELSCNRVSLLRHDGSRRTDDEILAASKIVNERNRNA